MGVGMLDWRAARPDQAKADVAEVAELWRAGNLRTAVDASYPLEKIQQIHEILDRRANQGTRGVLAWPAAVRIVGATSVRRLPSAPP